MILHISSACVNIIPVGATIQLHPSMHFIVPQAHYSVSVPMTALSPPVALPRAMHLTPAKVRLATTVLINGIVNVFIMY